MSQVVSAGKPFLATFKSIIDTAFGNAGLSDVDERVWLNTEPENRTNMPVPYGIIHVGDENESVMAGDKDTAPTVLFPTVTVWSTDTVDALDVETEIDQLMTDKDAVPTPSGWIVHNVRKNFGIDVEDVVSDGPRFYGRSLQYEIHLEPNT